MNKLYASMVAVAIAFGSVSAFAADQAAAPADQPKVEKKAAPKKAKAKARKAAKKEEAKKEETK